MVANGLSAATVTKTLRQLLSERGGDTHWRRAVILDRLQWDVFRSFYRRRRPDFSTFFLNSTAHFQHYHWRDMEPERFTIAPDPDAPASLMDAIRYGYECMDRLVGECLQMAPDATVVLATALSQQALTSYDEVGGKQVFKARSVEALMVAAGVARGWTYAPVMAEEFKLHFSSVAEAETAERRLDGLRMDDGRSVLRWRRSAETIFLACALHQLPAPGARVVAAGGAGVLFNDLFMPLEGLKSGAHHPDGILWWRLPQGAPAQVDRKVSLETIAPTVLDLLGVPAAGLREPLPEVLAASKVSAASSLAA